MPTRRFMNAVSLYLLSLPLSLGSSHIGKVLISAQFTRGFTIGLAIVMDAVATVWMVQAASEANKRSAAEPATDVE